MKEEDEKILYSELEERCRLLTQDNEAMLREITSLNRQIGGYKTSNANYKKQVADRDRANSKQRERYESEKVMLESKVSFLEELGEEQTRMLEKKDVLVNELQQRVQELQIVESELKEKIDSSNDCIVKLEDTIAYLRMPWWKRLFQ